MSNDVMILRELDKTMQTRAKRAGLRVVIPEGPASEEEFDRAIIVEPGTKVPWDLIGFGLHFLERWDAAVPMWRYGVNASDVGEKAERKRTQAIVRDLRVLLHSYELLFIRGNEPGRALLRTWESEREGGGDARLAFLRALYQVKPRLCVLPRSWLADVQQRAPTAAAAGRCRNRRATRGTTQRTERGAPRRERTTGVKMIRLEVAPGRYVRCNPDDAEKVKAQYESKLHRRRG